MKKIKYLSRKANLDKNLSLETQPKKKISLNSGKVKPVLVTNINTKETLSFIFITSAANCLGVDESIFVDV